MVLKRLILILKIADLLEVHLGLFFNVVISIEELGGRCANFLSNVLI